MEPVRSSAPVPRLRLRCGPQQVCAAFLWGLALFVLSQFVAGILLDQFGLPVRFAEATEVLESISAGMDLQVVFLGSSRFKGGVAAEEVARSTGRPAGSVRNAAVTAGDVIAADFLLEGLLERGARPRCVVVEVSPETLNHRTYWLRYHIIRQFTWADVPGYLCDVVALRETGTLLLSRVLPLYYYREALLAGAVRLPPARQITSGADAGVAPSLTPEQRVLSQQGVSHARRMMRDFRIGGLAAEALERLLTRCEAIGAPVLLVGAPVTSAFRTAYTPEIDAAYRAYLEDVTRRHHCRFFDYRDRVPDALFEDAHHLSAEGSRYFSRLLAREALLAE